MLTMFRSRKTVLRKNSSRDRFEQVVTMQVWLPKSRSDVFLDGISERLATSTADGPGAGYDYCTG
jgi:hypothetical protein